VELINLPVVAAEASVAAPSTYSNVVVVGVAVTVAVTL
jgi:hypothetical protein